MPKVSVIIPAYNCEKTLSSALGNLVNQTLKDIEIIIVNDCSTDNTWKIMTDCERQFSDKVMIINSDQNRGAGGARNLGLLYASGDYVGFVDSDDIPDVQMFEKLYTAAVNGNYDIVDCGFYNEKTDTAVIYTSDELSGELNDSKRSELIASGGYIWSKLFKRTFLSDLNISFRENVILEDCEFLMLAFAKAGSIGNVKEILYFYKCTDNSASKCVNPDKYYTYTTEAINAIYDTLSCLPNYDGIKTAAEYAMINICILCIQSILVSGRSENLMPLRDIMKNKISGDIYTNKYIINKISKKDMELLHSLLASG